MLTSLLWDAHQRSCCCAYRPAARAFEMYVGMACLKASIRPASKSFGMLMAGESLLLLSCACTEIKRPVRRKAHYR